MCFSLLVCICIFFQFRYSTAFERSLLALGALASIVVGAITPIMYILIGTFVNDIISNIQMLQNETISTTTKHEHSEHLHEASIDFLLKICGLGFVTLVCSFTENENFNYTSLKQVSKLFLHSGRKICLMMRSWYYQLL